MNEKSSDASNDMTEGVLREGSAKKLLSLLGLAARARRLVCGTDQCRDEIRRGKLPLVIVAANASENTKKRISDACRYYGCTMCVAPVNSLELSTRIGKSANIAVVGVNDMNFVNGITALFESASH